MSPEEARQYQDLHQKDTLFRAFSLLGRASENFTDREAAPDNEWFRDYFTLLRQPMVLTEEGWEPPSVVAEYRKEDPDWQPLEVLSFETEVPIHPAVLEMMAKHALIVAPAATEDSPL